MLQGYFAHEKKHPLPGAPWAPGHSSIVGSYEGAVCYERSTPAAPSLRGGAAWQLRFPEKS